MLILGLTKTTLLDYPGKVACSVFTGGCNLLCPYCHNAAFISPSPDMPTISEEEILQFLEKRVGKLQGVCISGGEPTLHIDLPDFISRIKKMGYPVKLDTNGTNALMLESLVLKNLVDYIAMDIKLPIKEYGALIKDNVSDGIKIQENLRQSIDFIMGAGVEYEFRTTVARRLHDVDLVKMMAKDISGAMAYYLQNYNAVDGCGYKAFENEELEGFKAVAQGFIANTKIRGF